MSQITPHGGKLISRIPEERERESLIDEAEKLPRISLNVREISDIEMIANGVFSPLEGFLTKKQYEEVVRNRHLPSGEVWTIPITLSIAREEAATLQRADRAALIDSAQGNILGSLDVEDVFTYDKGLEAEKIFRTADEQHPGVKNLYSQGDLLAGGKITLLSRPAHKEFSEFRLDPLKTREIFSSKGWRRIVGFQTRNPVHRAHEYIIKNSLEIADGLFLNPLVGETKEGDITAGVRMDCYTALLRDYFPKYRVVLGVYGAAMRYAGPMEAVLHAIARKNFGCTHFIVGRDHAGVGNYYGTYDAQRIFDEFGSGEIGITPLFFDNSFYCRRCDSMATMKTCPHEEKERFSLSGTKVRELLKEGKALPPEFTRPEVGEILMGWARTDGGNQEKQAQEY